MYKNPLDILAADPLATDEARDREELFSIRPRLLSLGGGMAGTSSTVDTSKILGPPTLSVELETAVRYVETWDL